MSDQPLGPPPIPPDDPRPPARGTAVRVSVLVLAAVVALGVTLVWRHREADPSATPPLPNPAAPAGETAVKAPTDQHGCSTPQGEVTGAYHLAGGSAVESGTVRSLAPDQSAVLVTGGSLDLVGASVTAIGPSREAESALAGGAPVCWRTRVR